MTKEQYFLQLTKMINSLPDFDKLNDIDIIKLIKISSEIRKLMDKYPQHRK